MKKIKPIFYSVLFLFFLLQQKFFAHAVIEVSAPTSATATPPPAQTSTAEELPAARTRIRTRLEATIRDINADKVRYFGHNRGGDLILDLERFDHFLNSISFNTPASLRSGEFQFDFKNSAHEGECGGQSLCLKVTIWPQKERKKIATGGFKTVKTNVLIFYVTPALVDSAPTRFVEATGKSPYLTDDLVKTLGTTLGEIFNPAEWFKITKVSKKTGDNREVYIAPYKGIPASRYGVRSAAYNGFTPISETDLEQIGKTLVKAAIKTGFRIYDIKPDNILLLYGVAGTPPTVSIIDYTTKVFSRAYLSVPERGSPEEYDSLTPELTVHYTASAIISTIHELDGSNIPMTTGIIERLLAYARTVPAGTEEAKSLASLFITHFEEKIRAFKAVPANFVWVWDR